MAADRSQEFRLLGSTSEALTSLRFSNYLGKSPEPCLQGPACQRGVTQRAPASLMWFIAKRVIVDPDPFWSPPARPNGDWLVQVSSSCRHDPFLPSNGGPSRVLRQAMCPPGIFAFRAHEVSEGLDTPHPVKYAPGRSNSFPGWARPEYKGKCPKQTITAITNIP